MCRDNNRGRASITACNLARHPHISGMPPAHSSRCGSQQCKRSLIDATSASAGADGAAEDYGHFEQSSAAASPRPAPVSEAAAAPGAPEAAADAPREGEDSSAVPSFAAPPETAGSLSYSAKPADTAATAGTSPVSEAPQAQPSMASGSGAPGTPPAAEPVTTPRPRALGADEKVRYETAEA